MYTIGVVKHGLNVIKGIENSEFSAGLTRLLLSGSGEPEAGFVAIGSVQPELSLSTTAVKTALADLGGANGIAIATSNFEFWYQKMVAGGLRGAGSTHIKATVVAGIIIPQTLTLSRVKEATLSYLVVMVSATGDAAPVSIAGGQLIDAQQGAADEAFTLGPVSLNDSPLTDVDEVTIDFGLTLWRNGPAGSAYLTETGILSRRPVITVKTFDGDTFASWGVAGVVQDSIDSVINMYPYTEGGLPTDTGAVTFTVDEGHLGYDSFGGQQGQKASGSVIITPTSDGVAETLAIAGLT